MTPKIQIDDVKAAAAYAELMRQLPVQNEQDDPDLVAAFQEADRFREIMEQSDDKQS